MTDNNSNIDLVIINAYTKIGEILLFCSKDIERKQIFERNSCINQGPYLQMDGKITCNNPKLDLTNINAYTKFGDILSTIFS